MTKRNRRRLVAANRARSAKAELNRPKRLALFYRWCWQTHRGLLVQWFRSPTKLLPKFLLAEYRRTGHRLGTRWMSA